MSDMDHRITTRIDAEIYKKLTDRARSERKTEALIVREALENHLNNVESAYDELMRLGGIGSGKGLPRDLSTNKTYMEGFGRNVSSRSSGHRSARRAPRPR